MKKLVLVIIGVIIFIVSIYAYNISHRAAPVISSSITKAEQVDKFNSLVPGVFILNSNAEAYGAIGAMFSSVGYDIMEGSMEEYRKLSDENDILIVAEKEAKGLIPEDIEYIIKKVKTGQKLITWGKSALSEELGISFLKNKERIKGYTWEDKEDVLITFSKSSILTLFSSDNSFEVLAEDQDKNPVMISKKFGEGDLIYSGIPLIGSSGLSYEHFPFILDAVKEQFNIMPALARADLAFYVDINYHIDESPQELADRIKSYGANQINLSAWYSPEEFGNTYREIIEECHKRGIAVFAWFELPFVSIDFWDKHPEWREKTASGEDAHIDWRRLMALNDPEALDAIKKYTQDFIESYDWDGVDIAEIYFESPGQGFEDPSKFTPMNDSFRKSFQERYGADPMEAFDASSKNYWKYNEQMKQNIIDYRVELITKLHDEFLLLCEELKKDKPYLQTSVTVIDSIADKNMREDIGVDAEAIAKLQDKYHFMLQIEDPFTLWNLGPDRYQVIGEEYRNMMSSGNQLSIDINVLDRGGEVYPTKKQRGVELYQLISNASMHTDKVILYALSTLEETDMELVPYTTSSDVEVQEISENEFIIEADKSVMWSTDTEGRTYIIDGVKWPFVSEQGVMIPGGEHKLEVQDSENTAELFIESINGEIAAVAQADSISFDYFAEGRFYITVNQKPLSIKIDGADVEPEMIENGDDCTIVLPEGKHRIELQ